MSYPFEAFGSRNQGRNINWIGFLSAGLAGWVALEIAFAVFVFVVPHGPHFAPEIGPVGSFLVLSLAYTAGYIPLFIVLAVPLKLLIAKANGKLAKRLLPLAVGSAFAVVSGGFECLNGSARNALATAILFAFAGVVCMAVLQHNAT